MHPSELLPHATNATSIALIQIQYSIDGYDATHIDAEMCRGAETNDPPTAYMSKTRESRKTWNAASPPAVPKRPNWIIERTLPREKLRATTRVTYPVPCRALGRMTNALASGFTSIAHLLLASHLATVRGTYRRRTKYTQLQVKPGRISGGNLFCECCVSRQASMHIPTNCFAARASFRPAHHTCVHGRWLVSVDWPSIGWQRAQLLWSVGPARLAPAG